MKIKLHKIKIKDIYNGYLDSGEEGVVAYKGSLDIRPKYQREFVYRDKQRNSVIDTIQKKFPLNVMYWVKNEDNFEILDGQQRTLSFCQYIDGVFPVENKYFNNLTKDKQDEILNYELMIYICEGTDSEKLDWFRIINIAGEKLTAQELRNAVYSGPWLTSAKRYFSKNMCPAYQIASQYLKGSPIRQEFLETVLKWISNDNIEEYMAKNQYKENADDLWKYFNNIIEWIESLFINYRKEQKGIEWGFYYNKYKDKKFNPEKLEKELKKLMLDEDVTSKKGIYEYLITGEEKYLSIRAFDDKIKREVFEKQNGKCIKCSNIFEIDKMEADHITPWSEGGATIKENCQMLCKNCNRRKSNK